MRISGRVKWFDVGKGYGFIVPDDPSQTDLRDVLLHVTALRSAGREHAARRSVDRLRRGPPGQGLAGGRGRRVLTKALHLSGTSGRTGHAMTMRTAQPARRAVPRATTVPPARVVSAGRHAMRTPQARWRAPRSNGSIAPRATASWCAILSQATSSSISKPCAAGDWKTCSQARTSGAVRRRARRGWLLRRSN